MVATIHTISFEGVSVKSIEVQVQIAPGLPAFTLVGLPDKAVSESRERVRSAIHAMGLSLPTKKVVVNLAPADIAKEGSHFDLPIALAVLVAMGVVPQDALTGTVAMGELALDGRLQPSAGVLPAAIHANNHGNRLICPDVNGSEAAISGHDEIWAAPSLLALLNHIQGKQVLSQPTPAPMCEDVPLVDMRDIKGQATARRALEVAAAGAHNMLLSGPPGAGKSMLAAALPGILPPMNSEEMLEYSMIASIAGLIDKRGLQRSRPYRSPHHSCSMPAMVGGGKRVTPGEISLAHNGVLFLDELPEFQAGALESLRQPLETGEVSIARVAAHVTFPARFQLVAAMNPCRCGYISDATRACSKAPKCGEDYRAKISGPLLDRIDLTLEVADVPTLDMLHAAEGEPSAAIAKRVATARNRQRERYLAQGLKVRSNTELTGEQVIRSVELDAKARELVEHATAKLRLSMRGYHRVLKVARTIADLEGSEPVLHHHAAEALSYRQLQHIRQMAG